MGLPHEIVLKKMASPIPSPTGPHKVGCVDIMPTFEGIAGTTDWPLLRLFYPTQQEQSYGETEYAKWYPTPEYAHAYINILRTTSRNCLPLCDEAIEGTADVKIPALYGVPLLSEDVPQFPIVVFSHGRIGYRTCYSGICSDLASHGFVVVVPEHGDGSSCLTLRRRISDSPLGYIDEWLPYCEKKENESEFEFRNRQVRKRSQELQVTIDFLHFLNEGAHVKNSLDPSFDLLQFKGRLQEDTMSIMGHSLGGATIIECLFNEPKFKCGIALDPWMMPVSEEVFTNGIHQPLIFINSSGPFQTPDAIQRMMKLVKPIGEAGFSSCHMVTIDGTIHRNQIDSIFVFSDFLPTSEKSITDPLKAHLLNLKLCHAFLKRFLLEDPQYQRYIPLLDGDDNEDCIIYGTKVKF